VQISKTKTSIVVDKISHPLLLFELVTVSTNYIYIYIILVTVFNIAMCITLVTTDEIPQKSFHGMALQVTWQLSMQDNMASFEIQQII
jgi:hypothetical protein